MKKIKDASIYELGRWKKIEVKKLLEKLDDLNPNDHIILFDYDSDQFYRFSELPESSKTGIYIAGIKKTKKPKRN